MTKTRYSNKGIFLAKNYQLLRADLREIKGITVSFYEGELDVEG